MSRLPTQFAERQDTNVTGTPVTHIIGHSRIFGTRRPAVPARASRAIWALRSIRPERSYPIRARSSCIYAQAYTESRYGLQSHRCLSLRALGGTCFQPAISLQLHGLVRVLQDCPAAAPAMTVVLILPGMSAAGPDCRTCRARAARTCAHGRKHRHRMRRDVRGSRWRPISSWHLSSPACERASPLVSQTLRPKRISGRSPLRGWQTRGGNSHSCRIDAHRLLDNSLRVRQNRRWLRFFRLISAGSCRDRVRGAMFSARSH